jgi:hypothetical protein
MGVSMAPKGGVVALGDWMFNLTGRLKDWPAASAAIAMCAVNADPVITDAAVASTLTVNEPLPIPLAPSRRTHDWSTLAAHRGAVPLQRSAIVWAGDTRISGPSDPNRVAPNQSAPGEAGYPLTVSTAAALVATPIELAFTHRYRAPFSENETARTINVLVRVPANMAPSAIGFHVRPPSAEVSHSFVPPGDPPPEHVNSAGAPTFTARSDGLDKMTGARLGRLCTASTIAAFPVSAM